MNTKFLVLLLLYSFLLVAAAPPPNIPQPPAGCEVFDYIEWLGKNNTHWGGYNIVDPNQVCGVGVLVENRWHVVTWDMIPSCNITPDGKKICDYFWNDGSRLRLMRTSTGIEGFDALTIIPMSAGIWWIPVQQQAAEVYQIFLPLVSGIGWGGPPPPPPLPTPPTPPSDQ